MDNSGLSCEELLTVIPQKEPFLFVDEITEVDANHIVGNYRYRPDAFFYKGHFPGNPITPGVILLETMAQIGVVAFGLYLLSLEQPIENLGKMLYLFSDCQAEYHSPVLPGEKIIVHAEKQFIRLRKLKTKAEMRRENGVLVASALLSGVGVST